MEPTIIPDDHFKEVCKPGSPKACIFGAVGGNGIECLWGTSLHMTLLSRKALGTMVAQGTGDGCSIQEKTKADHPELSMFYD